MIKIITTLVAASAIALAGTPLTQDKINELSKTSIFKSPTLKIIKGEDKADIILLKIQADMGKNQKRKFDGFIDKKTENLYIGDGFTKDGVKITFPMDMSVIENSVALTYGTGKKDLYVVTDPECPYCTAFAKKSEGKLGDYTVKVVLMPLSFHEKSRPMINHIISGKDNAERAQRYHDIMTKHSSDYEKTKANDELLTGYIQKVNDAVIELEVRGTPSFFMKDKDGKLKQVAGESLFEAEKKVEAKTEKAKSAK